MKSLLINWLAREILSKIKNKKIGIIDYELSNLGAIKSAVKKLNYEYKLIKEPKYLSSVEKIILPGVGSFKTAVENLLKSIVFLRFRAKPGSKHYFS